MARRPEKHSWNVFEHMFWVKYQRFDEENNGVSTKYFFDRDEMVDFIRKTSESHRIIETS